MQGTSIFVWSIDCSIILSVDAIHGVSTAMSNNPLSARVQYAACDFFCTMMPRWGQRATSVVVDSKCKAKSMKMMLNAVVAHIGKNVLQSKVWLAIDGFRHYDQHSDFFGSGGVPAMSLVLFTYESETFTRCPRGMVLDVFKCACKASESARVIDECLVQPFRKPLFLGSSLAIFAAQM